MHYLGGLRGTGLLSCGTEAVSRADYDFEGFVTKLGQVVGSGEIRMPPTLLKALFGRTDLELLTDDGRRLTLHLSDKQSETITDAAHVDVGGELPDAADWHL